jgi:hypothetical protein
MFVYTQDDIYPFSVTGIVGLIHKALPRSCVCVTTVRWLTNKLLECYEPVTSKGGNRLARRGGDMTRRDA